MRATADFQYLIATLPDPQDPSSEQEFDFRLEAIRRACERLELFPVGYWLPWQRGEATRNGEIQCPEHCDRQQTPGVVLFRSNAYAESMLALLIVRETPHRGVHDGTMQNALGEAARHEREIRVLGPQFSGSAASLKASLEHWCSVSAADCAKSRVRIISGSATNTQMLRVLSSANRPGWTFQTTVNSNAALVEAVRKELLGLGVFNGVVDSETAELVDGTTTAAGEHFPFGSTVIPVSDHVANLQDVWAATVTASRDASTRPSTPPSTPAAPIDAMPPLSKKGSASAASGVDEMLAVLRRQRVRAIGVLATSADDKIFLARQIRRKVSDVWVYLYGSNIDISNMRVAADLEGVLIVSSYPIFPPTQLWSRTSASTGNGPHVVVPFPSEGAEGTYNAALALIAPGKASENFADYFDPFESDGDVGPPIWISMAMGGALWPIAVRRADNNPDPNPYLFRPEPPPGERNLSEPLPNPPLFVVVAFVLVAFLAGLNGAALWTHGVNAASASHPVAEAVTSQRATPGASGHMVKARARVQHWRESILKGADEVVTFSRRLLVTYKAGQLADGYHEASSVSALRIRRLLVAAGIVVLGTNMIGMAVLLCLPWTIRNVWPSWQCWVFVMMPALLALGSLACGIWYARRFRGLQVHLFVILVVLIASLLLLPVLINELPMGRKVLLYQRLIFPSGGVTPVVPIALLLLAGYASHVCYVRRSRIFENVEAVRRRIGALKGIARFGILTEQLGLLRLWPFVCLSFLLLVFGLASLRHFAAIDGPVFSFFAVAAVVIDLTGAVIFAARAMTQWRRTKKFLRGLSASPMARALRHLPRPIATMFTNPIFTVSQNEVLLPLEQRGLQDFAAYVTAKCSSDFDGRRVADRIRAARSTEPSRTELDEISLDILRDLVEVWDDPQRKPPDWRKLAENVIAVKIAGLLSRMCEAIRLDLTAAALVSLTVVFALASYPFYPRERLNLLTTLVMLTTAIVATGVLVSASRDAVLSAISRTRSGRVTWDLAFVSRFVGFVGVPLLALLASQPWFGPYGTSIIATAMRAFLRHGE